MNNSGLFTVPYFLVSTPGSSAFWYGRLSWFYRYPASMRWPSAINTMRSISTILRKKIEVFGQSRIRVIQYLFLFCVCIYIYIYIYFFFFFFFFLNCTVLRTVYHIVWRSVYWVSIWGPERALSFNHKAKKRWLRLAKWLTEVFL